METYDDDSSDVLPVSHRLKGLVLAFSASTAQVGRCQRIPSSLLLSTVPLENKNKQTKKKENQTVGFLQFQLAITNIGYFTPHAYQLYSSIFYLSLWIHNLTPLHRPLVPAERKMLHHHFTIIIFVWEVDTTTENERNSAQKKFTIPFIGNWNVCS